MATLFDLTTDLLNLYEMATEPDLDAEALQDTIDAVEGEIEVKADGYAKVIRQMDGDIATLKAEIDRLSNRKKSIENSKDRIKKSLETAMMATGKTKFKTELFSFGIQKNPASLKFTDDFDMAELDDKYIKYADPEVNKQAVKDALKSGEEIAGCYLEQTESLRIR